MIIAMATRDLALLGPSGGSPAVVVVGFDYHPVRCRRSTVRDYGFELLASPRTLSASSPTVPRIIRQTNP